MTTIPTFSDRETIWVCGFPRSGNTWLARLLGDVLDSPVQSGGVRGASADEGFDRPGPFVIRQQHLRPPVDGKVVTIIRDPRDIAVSLMRYFEFSSLEEAIRYNRRIGTWQEFVRLWLSAGAPLVTYEGLHLHPSVALEGVLDLISVDYDRDRLNDVIDRQSFGERRKIASDKSNENGRFTYGAVHEMKKVLRRGIIGEWKETFNRETALIAHKLFNPLMYDLGYENDLNWWRQFTPTIPDSAN